MKAIGAKPIKRRDDSDVYTVSILDNPNTDALIMDSLEIASYLEKTYATKPIFPNNSEPLIRATRLSLLQPVLKFIFARCTVLPVPSSSSELVRRTSHYHGIRTVMQTGSSREGVQ